ncbi:hypothetical protein EVAR_25390_1 [Eumeta japonica]|uniref:Uncharacterized protein n=1 Tax=Eumeta variegata TaxID=151549 RepID=A0A4C1V5C2_EUMVA|nr:hypothetical protein EVAR_25390_1 [Eumeta japonica]
MALALREASDAYASSRGVANTTRSLAKKLYETADAVNKQINADGDRDSFESLCARLVQDALLTNSQDVTVRQKVLCALHFFCIGIIPKSSMTGHCVSQQALSEEDFRDEEVVVQDVNEEIDLRGLVLP